MTRKMGPFLNDDPHPEKSGLFLYLNTGKQGVTLNLKTEMGLQIFKNRRVGIAGGASSE
jgi:crotonobetainyl-CoA:carnitine CoA-transferase CaiB-like acyl-CoA transferase